MKRAGNLFNKIIAIDNLHAAVQKAGQNKAFSRTRRFYSNYHENIVKIQNQLIHGTYRTSPYRTRIIHGIKDREIKVLPFYDTVVQNAIMNVVGPVIHKTLTYNTYSCVKGRGIEGCAKRVNAIIRKFLDDSLYCLKIDIQKYYQSVQHEPLKEMLCKIIKDKRVLDLLFEIIDSSEGLPIGNPTSMHFANLYLAYFMHWVNEQLPTIVKEELKLSDTPVLYSTEYADDIVFFSNRKDVLHCVFKHINSYLSGKLKLTIKSNYQIFPIAVNRHDKRGRALDYVGYKFYKEQQLIRKRIKKNFCRRVAKLNKLSDRYPDKLSAKEYKCQVSAYLGWAKHSDSRHLLKQIIKPKYHENIL